MGAGVTAGRNIYRVVADMIGPRKRLRVLVFPEGEWMVAQALEEEIATQARPENSITAVFEHMLLSTIAIAEDLGTDWRRGLEVPVFYIDRWDEAEVITTTMPVLRGRPFAIEYRRLERSPLIDKLEMVIDPEIVNPMIFEEIMALMPGPTRDCADEQRAEYECDRDSERSFHWIPQSDFSLLFTMTLSSRLLFP